MLTSQPQTVARGTHVNNWIDGFNRLAARPPIWVRVIAPIALAFVAFGLAAKRGVLVGVVAAVVYGLLTIPVAVSPQTIISWSRQHPVLDGSVLGPLVFLMLAYITSWPLWVCVTVGLACVVVGAMLGMRRGRRLQSSGDDPLAGADRR